MCVEIGDVLLVNIYAPNHPAERELFFSHLKGWPWPCRDIILAGDFNSVQSPQLDRLGGQRTGRPESAQLGHLLTLRELEDARILSAPTDDEDPPEPTEFFTYWTKSTANRIDRFYLPLGWTSTVQ